jgi:hypothetical protein
MARAAASRSCSSQQRRRTTTLKMSGPGAPDVPDSMCRRLWLGRDPGPLWSTLNRIGRGGGDPAARERQDEAGQLVGDAVVGVVGTAPPPARRSATAGWRSSPGHRHNRFPAASGDHSRHLDPGQLVFDRVPQGVGQGPGDQVGVTHGQLDRDLATEGVPDDRRRRPGRRQPWLGKPQAARGALASGHFGWCSIPRCARGSRAH